MRYCNKRLKVPLPISSKELSRAQLVLFARVNMISWSTYISFSVKVRFCRFILESKELLSRAYIATAICYFALSLLYILSTCDDSKRRNFFTMIGRFSEWHWQISTEWWYTKISGQCVWNESTWCLRPKKIANCTKLFFKYECFTDYD